MTVPSSYHVVLANFCKANLNRGHASSRFLYYF